MLRDAQVPEDRAQPRDRPLASPSLGPVVRRDATCYIQGSKTVPESGDDAGALVITGSLVASLPTVGSASVTQVATWGELCSVTIAPANCSLEVTADNLGDLAPIGSAGRSVTATTLASPVAVADRQTISVRVVISFS